MSTKEFIYRRGDCMNNVNKTLFIPLYGKALVSNMNIILRDKKAEALWAAEGFVLGGKAKSKWLAYNMAIRARIYDDWVKEQLRQYPDALVLHIGCGLDSRCERVQVPFTQWIDADLPDVIAVRRRYFNETDTYRMMTLDASNPDEVQKLPDAERIVVVMEGLSMYLTNDALARFFTALQAKYKAVHVLLDIYTVFGAKASKYKNPINEVGVTQVYGIDDIHALVSDTGLCIVKEYNMTPSHLVNELCGFDKVFFQRMFTGKTYQKIYRMYEMKTK